VIDAKSKITLRTTTDAKSDVVDPSMTDPESEAMVGIERGMEGKITVEYLQLAW
jgi:hypothetical protein